MLHALRTLIQLMGGMLHVLLVVIVTATAIQHAFNA